MNSDSDIEHQKRDCEAVMNALLPIAKQLLSGRARRSESTEQLLSSMMSVPCHQERQQNKMPLPSTWTTKAAIPWWSSIHMNSRALAN